MTVSELFFFKVHRQDLGSLRLRVVGSKRCREEDVRVVHRALAQDREGQFGGETFCKNENVVHGEGR